MPELKRTFTAGKMNKDVDERMVPKNEYVDALNIEVNTSESSNVGTVQTLKGNTALTSTFASTATCVGTIARDSNNTIYWLVSDSGKNTTSSKTYTHTGPISITHNIYSDYIMEYDENEDETNYVVVENYKVESNVTVASDEDLFLYISNLNGGNDLRSTGIQPGMIVTCGGNKTTTIKSIEYNAPNWKVLVEDYMTTSIGDTVTFELPTNKRALGFSHFVSEKPNKLITGINIIDDLLFWTDGITEPKKINIKRCKYGSQQMLPNTYPNGTNLYATLLVVNGQIPSSTNGRLAPITTYTSANTYVPLSYRETTVIKKSPTTPLVLTMSSTTKADVVEDGNIIVDSTVEVPDSTNGLGTSSSDFFFSGQNRLAFGSTTPSLTFPQKMDWENGDTIEFYPDDEDAGNENDVLVTATISSIVNGDTFQFTIQSISTQVVRPFTTYRAKLKQADPLFEFKFPRFAYRWKYEDGEYSTYSPFSEVAFLPDKFDYLPKKGFNLGMTNNLRYLLLSGFKPKTTPLDVVEIDILYKESNSPNVYTVETIKSPSGYVESLETYEYEGDESWFGKVNDQENPNTLTTEDRLVSVNSFVNASITVSGNQYYKLNNEFGAANVKIGDKIEFTGGQVTGLASPVLISGIELLNSGTYVSLTANGAAVVVVATSLEGEFKSTRVSAVSPAVFVNDPQGSLEVKTDMIHATLPSNQLLRPFDNVPIKALSQEVTGNRVVYGNYTQNYDLKSKSNNIIKTGFKADIAVRKNVRDNVRFDDLTTLRNPNTGSTVLFWDVLNSLIEEPSQPERSLKSLRDYQIGVVYSDEYGRQTPVQTHESGVVRINKGKADKYNEFRIQLNDSLNPTNPPIAPAFATHYKYYVKENSNEYYNLAMDRFYSAEDGNIWLSFPSSERNKVDEETFLILKKQHDTDTFVSEEAKYKILAISNEAPLFIKTKIDTFGTISTTFGAAGEPKYQAQHIDVKDSLFSSSFQDALTAQERVLRVSSGSSISKFYDIAAITSLGNGFRRVTSRKAFGVDMSFTTDDGTNSGNINSGLSIELATKKTKTLPEFEGRFFVKIFKDGVFEKNILSKAPAKQYITTQTVKIGQSSEINAGLTADNDATDVLRYDRWQGISSGYAVPHKRWWASKNHPAGHGGDTGGNGSNPQVVNLQGVQDTYIDLMFYDGASRIDAPWGVSKQSNNFGAAAIDVDRAKKMTNSGQLFRFKGDDTVYRVKLGYEYWVKCFTTGGTHGYGNESSNHAIGIKMTFEPRLGSVNGIIDSQGNATGLDAIGNAPTGYDPRIQNTEGTTTGAPTYGTASTDTWRGSNNRDWSTGGDFDDARYNRTIEFLEEFTADESYSSDNPAIWETEPKENIDIDLYNEASETFPIDLEWNPYLGQFVSNFYFGSFNITNYYNCFSFANGVESNRIRDDYNAPTIDKGPKASTVLAEQYKQEQRKSGLIYSGIYNSTSGINNLNQFIQAEKITKDINPTYGSIQKLYSKETNLNVLCEDRIIKVLANKDALYNADGNTNITSTNNVLGSATPYAGDYGISTNPESFAVDQYRAYFTDKSRGAVIRLSRDGITAISDHGMSDHFEDNLKPNNISLIGSFDDNKDLYNITIKNTDNNTGNTASFSEKVRGWVTFQSWQQETGVSLNNKFYTYNNANLYEHYKNETRNNFYGTDYDSSICFMFNDSPSSVKNFSSINYEGTQSKVNQNLTDNQYYNNSASLGWYAESIETDLETGSVNEFINKENKWFNYIKGNKENTLANLDVKQFSTQGIGMLQSVTSTEVEKREFTFRVQDLGDTD